MGRFLDACNLFNDTMAVAMAMTEPGYYIEFMEKNIFYVTGQDYDPDEIQSQDDHDHYTQEGASKSATAMATLGLVSKHCNTNVAHFCYLLSIFV